MRRFLPWMLVCVLLLQIAGLNVLHAWQLSAHRKAQWRQLKQELAQNAGGSMVSVLRVADMGQLRWENAKEFELGGEMYDFIAARRLPQGWEVRALRDDKETGLKQRLAAQLGAEPMDPGRVPVRVWTRLLAAEYVPEAPIHLLAPDVAPLQAQALSLPVSRLLAGPPAPPPDRA